MKIGIAILIAIMVALAVALGWQLTVEKATNSQMQGQLAELTSKLGDRAAHENLDLQAKCSVQAEKVFRQVDKELRQPPVFGMTTLVNSHFQTSHYNTKLNKCFMLTESSTSLDMNVRSSTFINLSDAYEQRVYAAYMWTSDKVKKYWEVPPTVCTLIPSSAEEATCKSKEEFDAFVARFME